MPKPSKKSVFSKSTALSCLLLLFGFNGFAQDTIVAMIDSVRTDSIKPTIWKNLKYDAHNILGGIKYAYTNPFHWEKDDLLTAGGVVAGTAILFAFDEQTSSYFIRQNPTTPNIIKDFGWYFGSPQNNYGITGGVYLFGLLTDNEKIRKTGVLLISSATASGLIQTVTKIAVGRARPNINKGHASFRPFANEAGNNSFPSGHTILSFTTAYAIGKQFSNPWVKSGIYAVGMIAPVSRLIAGAHWLTDVTLSMALSIAVVDGIDHYLNKEQKYKNSYNPRKISWNMRFDTNSIGIVGTF